MKLVSIEEMQKIEREANDAGLTYEDMMENAGSNLAAIIADIFDSLPEKSVLGLVGSGNNGGDTLVALSILSQLGWDTCAYLVRPRQPDDPLVERFLTAGGEIEKIEDDILEADFPHLEKMIESNALLLDGILGTGARLPLKDEVESVLKAVRDKVDGMDQAPIVIAVDCPSGIDNDTGEASENVISADITVTMAAVKKGLLEYPASTYVGELYLVGIGLDDLKTPLDAWEEINRYVVDEEMVDKALPLRPIHAHKGTFGTAFIVAGSVNYTGAVLLAGEAAYRSGTGLVTLGVPASLHTALAGQLPEATWVLMPHEMGVISENATEIFLENMDRVTALLIGPGFGMEETTRNFLQRLFEPGVTSRRSGIGFFPSKRSEPGVQPKETMVLPPLVIDADGLKLLAKLSNWPSRLPPRSILTPHPGEMALMTGLKKEEIQANRIETAERYAKEWGHIVVLKGAFTVIADPSGPTAVIPVATAALARAGTGDVLSGLIVGLRAQGVDSFSAAYAGAWIHAEAGLAAAEELGTSASVLAGDVVNAIPYVMSRFT